MRPRKRIGRPRSIRALLATGCILPFASLLALWGFAASVTLPTALREQNLSSAHRLYGGAAESLGIQLTEERLQVFTWLSSAGQSSESPMLRQFRMTQAAVATFQNKVRRNAGLIDGASRPALTAFNTALNGLPALRMQIRSGRISALAAFQAYNAIVGTELRFFTKLATVASTSLYIQAAATVEAGRALDLAEREITLISGALAAGGQMSGPERQLFAADAAGRQLLMADALGQLHPALRTGLVHANASAAYRSFAAMERAVSASAGAVGPIPVSPASFGADTVPLFRDYQAAMRQDALALSRLSERAGDEALIELAVAGGAGLLAIVVSALLMVRFGRRISRELIRQQGAALDLAGKRLPAVVSRLSKGEDVDVAAEATPPPRSRVKEIARVSEAFAAVQSTAVEAAAGQARLRRGINKVFLILASRSQALLHRQLALLDAMERKTTDPGALDELYQLDHLTTRMRRHAEGLVILSGAAPARTWPNPVPIVDVLRGAIAEVEDYARIMVVAESADAVTGPAVADVIHLLAELIENAAANSPQSTEVTVRAGRVARGLAIEVEDRGVGIATDELAAINERLVGAAEFDLDETDQLGLFVVSRLAAKHDIKVTLRVSPFGGMTAIVLLPHAVMASARAETTTDTVERTQPSVFLPFRQRRRASLTPHEPPPVAAVPSPRTSGTAGDVVPAGGVVAGGALPGDCAASDAPAEINAAPADPAAGPAQVADQPPASSGAAGAPGTTDTAVAGSALPPLPKRIPLAARTAGQTADPIRAAGWAAQSVADAVRAAAKDALSAARPDRANAEQRAAASSAQAEPLLAEPIAGAPLPAESVLTQPADTGLLPAEPPAAEPPSAESVRAETAPAESASADPESAEPTPESPD
ncbi:MAG TPA: nitrate- and nitrite sensing domain-containing protein [Streptosporangiaceae bacterium]